MFMPQLRVIRPQRYSSRANINSCKPLPAGLLLILLCAVQAFAASNPEPQVTLNKSVSLLVANEDGTFTTTFTLRVKNVGNEELVKLQLKDDLDIFGSGHVVAIGERKVQSGKLTLNPHYDGLNDIRLLKRRDSLKPGKEAKLRFDVTFDPGNEPGPFTNRALVWTEGKDSGKGIDVFAKSKFKLPLNPKIRLDKSIGSVVANGDGTFTTPFTLQVTNIGNEELVRLQLKDDLDIFGSGHVVEVDEPKVLDGELTLNPDYDGLDDIRLLKGRDTLKRGSKAKLRFDVTFNPGNEPGPFTNRAVAWSAGKDSGIGADDVDKARIHLPLIPQIKLDKSAGDVASNGDGSLSVLFTLTVTNAGNDALDSLQIEDDLDIFGAGQLLAVDDVAGPGLSVNPGFDGLTDTLLLDGTDTLAPGTSATAIVTLRFDPGPEPGPFLNSATTTATGETSGTPVSDTDEASFLASPTQPMAAIALVKSAGEVIANGDGSLSVSIALTVTNVGNEALETLQIEDDLNIFGNGQLLAVEDLVGAGLGLNPDFDGLNDTRLLDGNDALPVANAATITFTLRFDPGEESGPFLNTAIATALGEISGTQVSDTDDASFLASPTQQMPAITLVKSTGQLGLNSDGSFSAPFTLLVTNVGNEALEQLQIDDNLDIFGVGQLLAVENVVSADLVLNSAFNGLTDTRLLDGTDSLSLAGVASVSFTIRFDPGTQPGPFLNSATATAVGESSGTPVSDIDELSFGESVSAGSLPPDIAVSKTADRDLVVRGDIVGYDVTVTNLTSDVIANIVVSDNPPAGLRYIEGSAILIRPGPDDAFDTSDDVVATIGATGTDPLTFDDFDLAADERARLRYLTRVITGITNGDHTNTVTVTPFLRAPVNASATVTLDQDPIFEKTTIIGKVFDDRNRDAWQNEGERGIAGVRLATVSGLTIETDAFGRYHLADVEVERFERGANFILKLDTASLPYGAELISENPRVIRLTQATMSRINFAVAMPDPQLLSTPAAACVVEELPEGVLDADTGSSPDPVTSTLPSTCIDEPPTESTETGATARQVTVSGGLFDCNTLVADVLPGRNPVGDPEKVSVITVYASNIAHRENAECPPRIAAGEYPIQVHTDEGSIIWVTAAGDIRPQEPPRNKEQIVVTPFRDESDISIVTALRIANEGIEPMPVEDDDEREYVTSVTNVRAMVEPMIIDPRLDVLALNQALVDDRGRLTEDITFVAYSNYSYFIKGYAVEIYGRSAEGFDRRWLATIPDSAGGPGRGFVFNGDGIDLSPYAELEYVLMASDCDKLFDRNKCRVDVTKPRLLKLPRTGAETIEIHAAEEIWGKSNLAEQRIRIRGGRVRVHGTYSGVHSNVHISSSIWRHELRAPVADGIFVLEEHLPSGTHRISLRAVGDDLVDGQSEPIPAHASGISVHGGLFGCRDLPGILPGRPHKETPSKLALTVVADAANRRKTAESQSCGNGIYSGQYPIEIRTSQDSIIRVTAAGDVLRKDYPKDGENNQHIIVMPFRDHTNNSIVTALRITNEGYPLKPVVDPVLEPLEIEVSVQDDYSFVVAMANLTVGQNNVSGNSQILAADHHFDGSIYTDGRLALFGRAKINGKYLLTAQLDSTDDELSNLTDNLKRQDPRRIFRQLDPDRYYAIYGDDSTTTTDVDTQGAFYLRVDWDKNTALWGNYNTGMTDTEIMQYNRSLYGAKLRHENQNTTSYGDAKTELILFGSEAQSVAAHVTFQATGGSLYYLRHTDIVQGSEKAWIEVRRRDTQQVVEREILVEGRDYEIDAIQGRIILSRPLSQVVNDRGPSIIRSTPLDGDDVFMLVDYEYVPSSFSADDVTYGGRGKVWLGNHVAVGATSVTDERNGSDYDLDGVDLTLKASEGTYLNAEFARSQARQNDSNFVSFDGGLSFEAQIFGGPGDALDGNAVAIEGRVNLRDIREALDGDIRAWWKNRDAGFSTGRLSQGIDITDKGLEAHVKVGQIATVTAAYSELELEQFSRERVARLQAEGGIGRMTAGVEIRHEDVEQSAAGPFNPGSVLNGATSDGEALLLGARLAYEISSDTSLYAMAQSAASDSGSYKENDLFSVGVNTHLGGDIALSVEASDGDRGSALTAGVDLAASDGLNFNLSGGVGDGAISQFATRYSVAEGHELYGSYTVDPDRTEGKRNLLTLGQRRAFGNRLAIFAESQFGKSDEYANVAHVFGIDFDGFEDWRISGSMQFSDNDNLGLIFERRAVSLGAQLQRESLRLSSRVEYREDIGNNVRTRQYITSNSFTKILNDDRRWLGQLNLSWTDDEQDGGRDARFAEFDIGYAYRPAQNDRLNLLAKYTFLYDLPTEGQATSRPDERSHLLALDGIYEFNDRWELGGKLAVKDGERRIARDAGRWVGFGLRLAAARARYHANKKWDALAEYRWLSDIDGDNIRHGALVGAYRQLGEHFKVGVGFNFTDFDDDLRLDGYNNSGWFVDFIGKH